MDYCLSCTRMFHILIGHFIYLFFVRIIFCEVTLIAKASRCRQVGKNQALSLLNKPSIWGWSSTLPWRRFSPMNAWKTCSGHVPVFFWTLHDKQPFIGLLEVGSSWSLRAAYTKVMSLRSRWPSTFLQYGFLLPHIAQRSLMIQDAWLRIYKKQLSGWFRNRIFSLVHSKNRSNSCDIIIIFTMKMVPEETMVVTGTTAGKEVVTLHFKWCSNTVVFKGPENPLDFYAWQ